MIWDFERIAATGNLLLPVGTVKTPDIAIEITDTDGATDWNKAGWLHPLIDTGDGDLPARGIYIRFGAQSVRVPYLAYKLQFTPVWYVKRYNIRFTRLEPQETDRVIVEQLNRIEKTLDELER